MSFTIILSSNFIIMHILFSVIGFYIWKSSIRFVKKRLGIKSESVDGIRIEKSVLEKFVGN